MKSVIISIALLGLVGCTDTEISSIKALGTPGHITCWSGTQKIYEGTSTGKIATVQSSDGWEFREEGSGNFIRVTGACVIRN